MGGGRKRDRKKARDPETGGEIARKEEDSRLVRSIRMYFTALWGYPCKV